MCCVSSAEGEQQDEGHTTCLGASVHVLPRVVGQSKRSHLRNLRWKKSESPPGGNQMQALVIGSEKWVVLLRVSHRAKPAVSKLPRYKVQYLQRSRHTGGRGLAERQDPDRVKQ